VDFVIDIVYGVYVMIREKKLSSKQLAVIEELFSGKLDEQEILNKYNVGRKLYNEWLADEAFTECLDHRIASSYRLSAAQIARSVPKAATALLELAESGKGDVARKACLDIISMSMFANKDMQQSARSQDKVDSPAPELSEQTASRLLAALAE
jgi:hypothetical protein